MENQNIALREVDEVNITILMDNTVDLLMAGSDVAQRFNLSYGSSISATERCNSAPIAEHGFSVLVNVTNGDKHGTVLFDAGMSSNGVLHNMNALGIDPKNIHTIILSHGHSDHTMGLPSLLDHLGSQEISLVLHPDALLERKIVMPGGFELDVTGPKMKDIKRDNVAFIEKRTPTLLADNMVLVSGEIERSTDFETGFPVHYSMKNDKWEPDPLIKDDQCLIMNVRKKGLVIITGCGHSGIINTIRHAQTITGNNKVLAVLGGFHLTGGIFEKIIPPTVAELMRINPSYVMPGHCTGWSAVHKIERAMPEAFIPNSVGTTLIFKG